MHQQKSTVNGAFLLVETTLKWNFFQHFQANFTGCNFAQSCDGWFVFTFYLWRVALAEHACPVGRGQYQLEAIGNLHQAVFNSNTGHEILRKTRGMH